MGDCRDYTQIPEAYIAYSSVCTRTDPCLHSVVKGGKVLIWNGIEICKFLMSKKVEIPEHFKKYQRHIQE